MIKISEAQKQRPHELLWMLWFDDKITPNVLLLTRLILSFLGQKEI